MSCACGARCTGEGDAEGSRKNEPKITHLIANAARAWDGDAAVGLSSEHKGPLLALWRRASGMIDIITSALP